MAAKGNACCVKNCPASNVAGLKYFSFPADIERRKKWLEVVGVPNINHEALKSGIYTICSAHFDYHQLGSLMQSPSGVPAKRTGNLVTGSCNASQTDFSDDDNELLSCVKRKLHDEKVIIFKRAKPVRKLIEICEIDCNDDTDICDDDIGGVPTDSLTSSDNEPRDSINLGNRKVFVFKEDKNAVKRKENGAQNKSQLYIELTPMPTSIIHNDVPIIRMGQPVGPSSDVNLLRHRAGVSKYGQILTPTVFKKNVPPTPPCQPVVKVGIPRVGQPNKPIPDISIPSNDIATPMNNVLLIPGISMEGIPIMVPIVMPQISVPGLPMVMPANTVQSVPIVQPEFSVQEAQTSTEAQGNIVISDVVSLTESFDKAFNKFFEWRDRTTDRRTGPKFDEDFNVFALNLHTINTRAYRLLMDSWQLPKEKTLKGVKLKTGPKFDDQLTKLLSQKFKSMSNEAKYCTLGLYSVALKPHLYYDPANDEVIGVHNVNGFTSKLAANHALVAMVRGLKVPWHQLVAFSLFSTMTDVDSIEKFVTNIIVKLKRMGIKIKGVVMSDDPCFWKYCRSKHFISPTKVYLTIDKEHVYTVFDIPHIINKFQDDFINNDFIFDNKTVSWKYVKQVYDLDKEKGGTLLSKLSDEHLQPGRKDFKACQVFSGTVSKTMQFYIDEGLIDKEATATANFIKKLDEVLDVVNVSKLTKLPSDTLKRIDGQLKTRANVLFKALDSGHLLFKKLKVAGDANKEVDSVKYLITSLKSLYLISLGLKELQLTGLLKARHTYLEPMQDFLKSAEKEAKTNILTPVQFTRAFSKYSVKNLIELTPSPKSIGNMDHFLKMADGLKDCYEEYEGNRISIKTTDYRFKLPDEYAIIYVSSYLTYKCLENHRCKAFEEFVMGLVDLNKTKIYAHFAKINKNAAFYNQLKLPAMSFVSYIERLDNLFTETFDDVYHTNPAETIFDLLKSVPKWDYPCTCFPRNYLLKLFVRTRIYHAVLSNTRNWKNRYDTQCLIEVKKL